MEGFIQLSYFRTSPSKVRHVRCPKVRKYVRFKHGTVRITLHSNFNKIISNLWFSTARCGFGGWVSARTPYLAAPSTAPAIPIPALACLPWGLGLLHSWDTRQPAVPFGGPSRTATPQAANRVCSLTQSYFVSFSQSWTLVCFSRTQNKGLRNLL